MVGLNKVVCDCVLWRSGSHWYTGNWKSCNVCRIFSVKAIFETRESRPKFISSTREQNFQKCPALILWLKYQISFHDKYGSILLDLKFRDLCELKRHSYCIHLCYYRFKQKNTMCKYCISIIEVSFLYSLPPLQLYKIIPVFRQPHFSTPVCW